MLAAFLEEYRAQQAAAKKKERDAKSIEVEKVVVVEDEKNKMMAWLDLQEQATFKTYLRRMMVENHESPQSLHSILTMLCNVILTNNDGPLKHFVHQWSSAGCNKASMQYMADFFDMYLERQRGWGMPRFNDWKTVCLCTMPAALDLCIHVCNTAYLPEILKHGNIYLMYLYRRQQRGVFAGNDAKNDAMMQVVEHLMTYDIGYMEKEVFPFFHQFLSLPCKKQSTWLNTMNAYNKLSDEEKKTATLQCVVPQKEVNLDSMLVNTFATNEEKKTATVPQKEVNVDLLLIHAFATKKGWARACDTICLGETHAFNEFAYITPMKIAWYLQAMVCAHLDILCSNDNIDTIVITAPEFTMMENVIRVLLLKEGKSSSFLQELFPAEHASMIAEQFKKMAERWFHHILPCILPWNKPKEHMFKFRDLLAMRINNYPSAVAVETEKKC